MLKKNKLIDENEILKLKNERIKKELEEIEEANDELNEKIKDLQEKLNEVEFKNLTSEKEIRRAKDETDLTKMKLKDMERTLDEYRKLPDLKNMIDNLSSLTTPQIDRLIKLIDKTDFKELINFNEKIGSIEEKLDMLINVFRDRRRFF